MNETLRGLLAVGTRLAYDGQWLQVAEMDGPHVLLASPAGARRVSAGHLLADPSTLLPGAPGDPVEGAGPELARLDDAEGVGAAGDAPWVGPGMRAGPAVLSCDARLCVVDFTARSSRPSHPPLTCAYAFRGAIAGRRRPLCVRGHRVPGSLKSTDGARTARVGAVTLTARPASGL